MRRRSAARDALHELNRTRLVFPITSLSDEVPSAGFVVVSRRFNPVITTPSVVSLPDALSVPPTSTMPSHVRFDDRVRLLSTMSSPRPSFGSVQDFLTWITGQ